MDEYPTHEESEFIEPILKCISDKAIGKEPDIQRNPDTEKFEPYLLTESEGKGKFIRRTSRKGREAEIVVKSSVRRPRDLFQISRQRGRRQLDARI